MRYERRGKKNAYQNYFGSLEVKFCLDVRMELFSIFKSSTASG